MRIRKGYFMNIILATEDDLKSHKDELIEIIEYSLKVNNQSVSTRSVCGGAGKYNKMMHYYEEGKTNVWLAVENERAVGFAQFFQKDTKRVHLNEIAVAESFQHNGIGSVLMNYVENSARECGANIVELFCSDCNKNAMQFYMRKSYTTERRLMIKDI